MNINESPDPRSSLWAFMAYLLRFHRMERGMSGGALADLLNCARSSISRLENADAKLTDAQAAQVDQEWRTGGLFGLLLYYARLGHEPNWLKSFNELVARAFVIKIYSGQLIPGLLQTPEYARALFVAGREPDIPSAVEARMARQDPLHRPDPPEVWVLLAETALLCHVGGRKVMRDQLARLLELSELPNVILRVVPNSAGANLGLDGPFKIVTVKEGSVAYLDALNGGRLAPETSEVAALDARFNRIGAVAEPMDSSRRLIREVMETFT
ncbi:helix-turn-helix domain-containing protein [Actinoallomurus iriomotensis]|uniref:Transcriptional regulator n=1 Tax=Actinoallomurus iriomotensis TaxID=478107 RepID=A0A9W6S1K5_9ACTN|nr:helix-turn-helix transcriptional regulator [Actinoallomurus iriomotensis]GLY86310.1 transcriptional regulator [Actinoallomurus iriomotensis]